MDSKIEYREIADSQIIYRKFSGKVCWHDIFSSWEYILSSEMLQQNHKGIISDYSDVKEDLELDGVDNISDFFTEHKDVLRNIKLAVVVDSPSITYPMLVKYRNQSLKSEAFSTPEAAIYWILVGRPML